jgi:hypothetical protein
LTNVFTLDGVAFQFDDVLDSIHLEEEVNAPTLYANFPALLGDDLIGK